MLSRSIISSTIAFTAAILMVGTGFAQQWVVRYDGPGNSGDSASAIAVDVDGNVYVTGSSYGDSTSTDYCTVSYDSDGNERWVQRYDGPGNSWDSASA
ncbi:MAG: SBBP repeat-containing protein, partial [Thermodesulfobacteriota bacterium]|nr:SBBP repeat-containing protein [Thermodesulfobacteriota bacterium]